MNKKNPFWWNPFSWRTNSPQRAMQSREEIKFSFSIYPKAVFFSRLMPTFGGFMRRIYLQTKLCNSKKMFYWNIFFLIFLWKKSRAILRLKNDDAWKFFREWQKREQREKSLNNTVSQINEFLCFLCGSKFEIQGNKNWSYVREFWGEKSYFF